MGNVENKELDLFYIPFVEANSSVFVEEFGPLFSSFRVGKPFVIHSSAKEQWGYIHPILKSIVTLDNSILSPIPPMAGLKQENINDFWKSFQKSYGNISSYQYKSKCRSSVYEFLSKNVFPNADEIFSSFCCQIMVLATYNFIHWDEHFMLSAFAMNEFMADKLDESFGEFFDNNKNSLYQKMCNEEFKVNQNTHQLFNHFNKCTDSFVKYAYYATPSIDLLLLHSASTKRHKNFVNNLMYDDVKNILDYNISTYARNPYNVSKDINAVQKINMVKFRSVECEKIHAKIFKIIASKMEQEIETLNRPVIVMNMMNEIITNMGFIYTNDSSQLSNKPAFYVLEDILDKLYVYKDSLTMRELFAIVLSLQMKNSILSTSQSFIECTGLYTYVLSLEDDLSIYYLKIIAEIVLEHNESLLTLQEFKKLLNDNDIRDIPVSLLFPLVKKNVKPRVVPSLLTNFRNLLA